MLANIWQCEYVQGDPYGRGIVFVDCYLEVTFSMTTWVTLYISLIVSWIRHGTWDTQLRNVVPGTRRNQGRAYANFWSSLSISHKLWFYDDFWCVWLQEEKCTAAWTLPHEPWLGKSCIKLSYSSDTLTQAALGDLKTCDCHESRKKAERKAPINQSSLQEVWDFSCLPAPPRKREKWKMTDFKKSLRVLTQTFYGCAEESWGLVLPLFSMGYIQPYEQ